MPATRPASSGPTKLGFKVASSDLSANINSNDSRRLRVVSLPNAHCVCIRYARDIVELGFEFLRHKQAWSQTLSEHVGQQDGRHTRSAHGNRVQGQHQLHRMSRLGDGHLLPELVPRQITIQCDTPENDMRHIPHRRCCGQPNRRRRISVSNPARLTCITAISPDGVRQAS